MTERTIMASALLLIATFHAVLWVSLAVLTFLEPPHRRGGPELLAPPRIVPDEALPDDGESLRPAA
jgi:hypothetical protein